MITYKVAQPINPYLQNMVDINWKEYPKERPEDGQVILLCEDHRWFYIARFTINPDNFRYYAPGDTMPRDTSVEPFKTYHWVKLDSIQLSQ